MLGSRTLAMPAERFTRNFSAQHQGHSLSSTCYSPLYPTQNAPGDMTSYCRPRFREQNKEKPRVEQADETLTSIRASFQTRHNGSLICIHDATPPYQLGICTRIPTSDASGPFLIPILSLHTDVGRQCSLTRIFDLYPLPDSNNTHLSRFGPQDKSSDPGDVVPAEY
ncbi:hypothetical protein K490DRAFT_53528 [Saccharata proteae CBS 121410]|uniref:Uncharacterized protein n=1 Tax=Saccharata proteae CBS 121410 TaxID=1314787 RepID=A0A9P4M0U2_9PEZI|nr:hypothetical protein K490DRAFT_53528 [Saccharata proteae CBS 121410]